MWRSRHRKLLQLYFLRNYFTFFFCRSIIAFCLMRAARFRSCDDFGTRLKHAAYRALHARAL